MNEGKTTILVVDEIEASRSATVATLRAGGFDVIEAATGNEALGKARLGPGLVILDINLPDMNGTEVCRRLKADPATSSILVLHLIATNLTLQDDIAGLEDGADGYLFRPVNPFELLANLNVLLRLKRSELEKELEARQWHITFDAIGDAICLLDPHGRILRYNKAFQNVSGAGESELTGRLCHDVIHHTSSFIDNCPFFRARETNKRAGLETQITGRWYRIKVDPVPEESGKITCFVHVMVDITERKKAENELKASERRYYDLFQANPHPMWVYDLETLRFLEVNDAAVAHYNYSRDEFLAMTIKDIRPADDIPRLKEHISYIHGKMNKSGIWRHLKKNGSVINVEITSHSMLYDDRPARMILANDITEQLHTQARSERLMAAIEQAGETIIITDTEGILQYVNPAFERITGYTREEALGKKMSTFKSEEHDAAFYSELQNTISSGSVWKGRFINRRKDGTLYNEDAAISPVRDTSGRIVNYVAVKRDITESLKLEAQLQQAQKMESVGRLAGGVAHDFNNMLSVILGYTELALGKTDPTDSLHQNLQEIHAAAVRSANITRQLLAFARKQTITPRVLNLNETVEGMLTMLRRLIGEDINLTWQPGANVQTIKIDPSQIDQILANLCVNARDAIKGVGKLTIETAMVSFDAGYCMNHTGSVPGDYILLAVSDDGCGMEKQILDKVFDPFFTTKDPGQGTGLGLAMVYGIVKQNNGFISVYSEPGKGTTFRIYLPRHTKDAIEVEDKISGSVQLGHGETILVVEDEVAILKLTGMILEHLGYNVLTANTPKQALRLAEEQTAGIHLLITDVIMPEMNGRDLADVLLSFYPKLKCLFMSGYTASIIANQGVLDEGMHFIQKPFSTKELADKVSEVLVT